MNKQELIKKIIIITFDLSVFLTFCLFAKLLNALLVGIFLFLVFIVINSFLPYDKRIHADKLLHCFVLSIFFLISCIFIYKFSLNYMNNEDSMILSCLVIILANFSTTECLWWRRNKLNARVLEWVRFNLNNEELINYKQKLKDNDKKKYYIYIYYFEEQKSLVQIASIMNIDMQRISEEINIMSHYIEYSIRLS